MKPKKSISDDLRAAIELRAYYIWEREGRPEGRQHEHWAAAEAEILSAAPVKQAAAPKKPAAKKPAEKKAANGAAKPEAPVKTVVAAKAVKTKKAVKAKAAKPRDA